LAQLVRRSLGAASEGDNKMRFYILIFAFISIGCGRSNKEYADLKLHSDSLLIKIGTLEKELQEFRNGADVRINEIRDAFQNKDFNIVFALTDSLRKYHPASPQYQEAKELARKSQVLFEKENLFKNQEIERQKLEASKSECDKARDILRVKYVRTASPNSAGGVDLSIYWHNRSKKTIKYVHWTFDAYNAVNDPVSCTIRGDRHFIGKETGPFVPGSWNGGYSSWECAWYNYSIVKAKLIEAEIEYMDGTTLTLQGNQIEYIQY
jgi:hypothetical protein